MDETVSTPTPGRLARFKALILLLNRLPGEVSRLNRRVDQLTAMIEANQRENRLLLGQLSLPARETYDPLSPVEWWLPAKSAYPGGDVCRQASFDTGYFGYWSARLYEHLRHHRKLWEFVFICQALYERGALQPGVRGLGFGVGLEPLTALFACEGVEIMATDLEEEAATDLGWTDTKQHATGREALRRPQICPDDVFDRNVRYRSCDMNAVPDDLTGFDFCWSACALEHLGSIEKGLAFIERSVDCLKPGGWAIHTTEFNLSSNADTVDDMSTVLFRKRDFEALAERLKARGHEMLPINYDPGNLPLDTYYDVAPYREWPHVKMALSGYAATSIGIIVRRGTGAGQHENNPE